MNGMTFTIGQLARTTDTKAVTIRYYEQAGLLPAASRNASGYRVYSHADRDRLLFIRRGRSLGFSLNDIRELLELADHRRASCAAVDAKVAAQLEQVQRRLRDLQGLERELQRLLARCEGGLIEECRIIESLSDGYGVEPPER
ncbi:MerR family transcriptional regulator [Thiococcus pfennigii]|uniref:MerR family transcriptional regulator n=2 Tax=Thiococcus pfennigii TaxID=1057 RepID=UPI001F5B39AC|nr:helix-turn-helix domain-containing protein [Thiococcus pfennigii]MBK1699586.1 MerR family transcriptional regulator [Thiococcus pfennigii]MBK1731760.1 MerR family transcriptional regulator [Thiococcus pfennigii]